jgi:hypothetical protein
MCGARCRDPKIRREALRLLEMCNRREGLWDSAVCARVIGTIIRLEESRALQELGLSYEIGTITRSEQISITATVGASGVQFDKEQSGMVIFKMLDLIGSTYRERLVREKIRW